MKLEEIIEKKKNGEYVLRTDSGVMKLGRRPERYIHTSKLFDDRLRKLDAEMKKSKRSKSTHSNHGTKPVILYSKNANFI